MNFAELTLSNGQPLDIPAGSIVFLETMDEQGKQSFPGALSGVFFDLGSGAQNVPVQQPFPPLAELARGAHPGPWLELQRADKGRVLIRADNLASLRGLGDDHPNDGRCQITHRVGSRLYLVDVVQTRDEIKAMLPVVPVEQVPEG